MHRSGTSAFAGSLGKLGSTLPTDLMGAGIGNEKGHWEPQSVVTVNDKILESGGSHWEDWDRFNPGWYSSVAYPAALVDASAALRASFGDARLFVMKDPRLCRLVPFWLDVFTREKINPAFLLCVRHPAQVAISLAKRDGMEHGYANLLWLRYTLEAEVETRGRSRTLCDFDQLRENWSTLTARIGQDLGIVWPRQSAQMRQEMNQFISSSENALAATSAATTDVIPLALRVYRILRRWADQGEDAADHAQLDDILRRFNEMSSVFADLILPGSRSLGAGGGHVLRAELESTKATLSAALEERANTVNHFQYQLGVALEQQAATAGVVSERDGQIVALQAELEDMYRQAATHGQTRTERDEALAQILAVQAQLNVAEQSAADLAATLSARDAALAMLRSEVEDLSQSLAQAQLRGEQIDKQSADTVREMAHQLASLESQLRQREEEIAQTCRERNEARAEIAQMESVKAQLNKAQADILFLTADRRSYKATAVRAERAVRTLEQRIQGEHAGRINAERVLTMIKSQMADIVADRDQLRADLDARSADNEALLQADDIGRQHNIVLQGELERSIGQIEHGLAEQHRLKTELDEALVQISDLETKNFREQQAQAQSEISHQILVQGLEDVLKQERDQHELRVSQLTAHLSAIESQAISADAHRKWMQQVHAFLLDQPAWWGIMPRKWRRQQQLSGLKRSGLFDGETYLALNPDVAATGADPLQHYEDHGRSEGRMLPR